MKFNLKRHTYSKKDYSFSKTHAFGVSIVPDFIIPSNILNQGEAECTAFSVIGARESEIPNSSFDATAFWNDELKFAGVAVSNGFELGIPAAVAVKTGFCPQGNPTLRQNNASAYYWIHPHDGMDWFDSVLSAVYQTKYPAVGGLDWYNEWTNLPGGKILNIGSKILGGHAIRIAGKKTENGIEYAGLPNSWGTGVGDNGWYWISRDVFNQSFGRYAVYILSDSQNQTIKTLGLISALYENILSLLQHMLK